MAMADDTDALTRMLHEFLGGLEKAYEDHDTGLTTMLLHTMLANLRDDPRWIALLNKMGLPH